MNINNKNASVEFVEFKELDTPSVNISGKKEERNWE